MTMRAVWGLAMLLAAATASAQSPPPAPTVKARSEQTAVIRDQQLAYTAEVGLVPVASKPGRQDATAGYVSYSRAGAANRPVLFVFNGGPGAASAYLQMGALGPFRARVPQDPTAPLPAAADVAANPDTLLDVADLVFLDPPGTGFSALGTDADTAFYRSVKGDADAVAQLARGWLAAHGRAGAPLYILGESYGTIRAAAMVDALREQDSALRLRGVLLLGQALNMIETSQRPDNVVTYPVSLPTLAAIACYHHVRPAPCTPEGSAREASAYAEPYLTALFRGRALDAAGRASVAAKLQALTGISRSYYLAHDLRISKEQFRVELLRAQGKVLGRYDARYTAPRPADAGETVGPDAFSAVSDLYGKAVIGQLARIGVADAAAYKVIVRGGDDWRYGSGDSPFNDWPFMARLERAMTATPGLRLFVGTGLYDLTTTVGAADYLFAQSDLAPDRYRNRRYPAGHVAYSDDTSWRMLIADLRAFLTTGAGR
ncbi:septum formation initiator [Sphingomonas sp. RP10(2022)]|uniref:Septum formation initiator n=1 Tax=Sphingomonas liriopis TaxID=2949094 RepID=A0A9X2HVC1_9SPHN|nr:septum formation initiator [Sphingomonas liriopis]MCP3734269.1 septum formation initiator [Sphingomonas liriopis]